MTEAEYIPFEGGYTIEELIDLVQNELTISCALPKSLPDANIRQIVETRALPWFYRSYQFAVQKIYFFIHKDAFTSEEFTKYSYVQVPCAIQSVVYLYEVRGDSLFQLGINTPNLSVNLGVTNQPYLSSYVTTIGELGVYKTVLDSMSDMLNQMNLYTTKYHFNQLTHRLNILTKVNYHLILEAYVNIPAENMFSDTYFTKYVTAWAKMQQGRLLGTFDFSLPGGIKYNSADMVSQGKEEMKEVEEEIKGQSNSAFFFLVKR